MGTDPIILIWLQVVRLEAGVLRNAREHAWTDLVAVMKGENEIRPTGTA